MVLKAPLLVASWNQHLSYGILQPRQARELTTSASLLAQVVIVVMMVVLTVLETALSFGVLRCPAISTPGTASWTSTIAVCTGATSTSPLAPLFVASRIDYWSIWLFVGEQMRAAKGGFGGNSPQWVGFILSSSKINHHGMSRRIRYSPFLGQFYIIHHTLIIF